MKDEWKWTIREPEHVDLRIPEQIRAVIDLLKEGVISRDEARRWLQKIGMELDEEPTNA